MKTLEQGVYSIQSKQKRHQNNLTDIKIPHLFLLFHCWISGSNRQVKIMKDTKTDANYSTLIKRVKLQHEMKPVLNLKSMQNVCFEQTFTKFVEIFVPQE